MRHGLGSEHPLCDKNQLLMLVLFFSIWGIDKLSYFAFGYSTVIFEVLAFPAFFIGALLTFCLNFYLVSKSHKSVLEQVQEPPELVDSGVYAWIRQPMYLMILLFYLSFLFVSFSRISFVVLFGFVTFYDRMATYEEKSLIKILGTKKYLAFQKGVFKWLPRLY